ncbi:MAG: hypothetical protein U5K27_02000 [Desulfotignum sp.]|nr:hypothetical protein [Desulfotignum sp.]
MREPARPFRSRLFSTRSELELVREEFQALVTRVAALQRLCAATLLK